MEIYIISNEDLSIKSVCEPCSYSLNLDEETNGKSEFVLPALNNAKKGYFLYASGLNKPFVFLIDDILAEKDKQTVQVSALDISNIFDRKIIETNTDQMSNEGIEDFIADCISENFINSDDPYLNIGYIEIHIHSHTKRIEQTNSENGLFNLHTFITNCRQNKNIYCDFTIDTINQKMIIDIENRVPDTVLIDTTLEEVTHYNKVYDVDVVAKVTVLIREENSTYNLYLLNDRTTTTDKTNPNRVNGRIEVISVDTADKAQEEALNVMKGNTYKHLVEFNIAKTSQLVDVSQLEIGTPIKIKTEDDIYDSYISAILLNDTDNFVSFKSGSLRVTLVDKLKQGSNNIGNKLDVSGGKIIGSLDVSNLKINGSEITFAQVYSTSELNTGGLWTNGEKIYRKVYIGECNNEVEQIIDSSLNANYYRAIVKLEGFFVRIADNLTSPIGSYISNENSHSRVFAHHNNGLILTKDSLWQSGFRYVIIAEYTKRI